MRADRVFKNNIAELTAEKLRASLHYNPETGVFTRLKQGGRFMPGEQAGCVKSGRFMISLGKHRFMAHRLAWLYMTGSWPIDTIDHIDRNPLNNTWENLRMATPSEQGINKGPARAEHLTGTYRRPDRTNLWAARIKLNRVNTHLGYFKTEREAHEAYLKAKSVMHVIGTYPKEAQNLRSPSP